MFQPWVVPLYGRVYRPVRQGFNEMRNSSSTSSSQNHMSRVEPQHSEKGEIFVLGLWGVRYQVEDVVRSVVFYTERVGFKLDQQNLPAFAQVSVGHLKLKAVQALRAHVQCRTRSKTRAGRVEPDSPSSRRPTGANRGVTEGRCAF